MGKGRFDDGIEPAWNCSACKGSGRLSSVLPPRFERVQVHVLGYSILVRDLTVGVWSHAEKQASLAMQAGQDPAYWLARMEEAAGKLAGMEARR
jgi:hypothetical protein